MLAGHDNVGERKGLLREMEMIQAPHKVDVAVGRTIRIRRQMAKLSQDELGKRIGVTFQQVQKYENGRNRVSASMLVEIAFALQIDVRSLFDGVPDPKGDEPNGDFVNLPGISPATRDMVQLNQAFAEINNAGLRRKLLDLVKTIARSQTVAPLVEDAQAADIFAHRTSVMPRVGSLEFQRNFGEFQHQAQREPVEITRHGRREFVLMSADHYDWLKAAAQRTQRTADAADVVIDAVERAEMDTEHAALDDLLR